MGILLFIIILFALFGGFRRRYYGPGMFWHRPFMGPRPRGPMGPMHGPMGGPGGHGPMGGPGGHGPMGGGRF